MQEEISDNVLESIATPNQLLETMERIRKATDRGWTLEIAGIIDLTWFSWSNPIILGTSVASQKDVTVTVAADTFNQEEFYDVLEEIAYRPQQEEQKKGME